KQCALPSVLSLDKALHWRPPLILNPSNHSKDDANVFTRSGPISDRCYGWSTLVLPHMEDKP
ncbi:hypothetical protein ACTX1N_28585, partial [Pseudomonas aeruginosa]|nr:hypothetical protein [Pseudomonas aeruginosa]